MLNYVFFFFPRILQLLIFTYWSNIVLPNLAYDPDRFESMNKTIMIFLNILSMYIMVMEIPIILHFSTEYFMRIGNVVNIAVTFLIGHQTVYQDLDHGDFWEIQTWLALFIWFRMLIKMRVIGSFSYLIRMIIGCAISMGTFMIVLIVGVFAFADAFTSINKVLELNGKIPAPVFADDVSEYGRYW